MAVTNMLLAHLAELEEALRSGGLWSSRAPAPNALQSVLPFCVDTLTLEQWLQFVFLPQMRSLLASGAALPAECSIAPMAEQAFADYPNPLSDVVRILTSIDELLRNNY